MNAQRGRKNAERTRRGTLLLLGVLCSVLALSVLAYEYGRGAHQGGTSAPESGRASAGSALRFSDPHRQAAEFISYNRSLVLTPEQRQVMNDALSSIPAPCCAQHSIATCCCPCNLAKSTWGLAKFLIVSQHATVAQLRTAASDWLHASNPGGYSGDACFTNGCSRAFEQNGCGGMDDRSIQ